MTDNVVQPSTVSIAQSLIPWAHDDNKARYLSYRASGFSIREALHMVDCAHSTLSLWRKDPTFLDLENRLPEFADKLRTQFAGMDFVRNFRLVLQKDFIVLKKSLGMMEEENKEGKLVPARLTTMEAAYLGKMRSMYSPQALAMMESILRGETAGDGKKEFDWTEIVLKVKNEKSITLRRADSAMSEMSEDDDKDTQHSVEG